MQSIYPWVIEILKCNRNVKKLYIWTYNLTIRKKHKTIIKKHIYSTRGGSVLKSQTYRSTKVLSRENLRTTTPFTVFGILVPKYYSIYEANLINTTLSWINLTFHLSFSTKILKIRFLLYYMTTIMLKMWFYSIL